MQLVDIIQEIHIGCSQLCEKVLRKYLPVAGNVGIFCQTEEEYAKFIEILNNITLPSDNPNQKYFELEQPITIPKIGDIPESTYTHLYVRKPSSNSPQRGDIDYVLPKEKYMEFKNQVLRNEIEGANIYDRPGWDTVELHDPKINTLAYISTQEMAERVRVRF